MPRLVDPAFFESPAVEVARGLIGMTLGYGGSSGVIVETEAYAGDAASHFVTRPRTGRMLGDTFGLVYLYRIYGVHSCLNFTCDRAGPGGVLIRAIEPVTGIDAMRQRRKRDRDRDLTSGPAKLFVALGVDWAAHGQAALEHFRLMHPDSPPAVEAGSRIGIRAAIDLPWRFRVPDNPFVSRAR